VLTALGLGRAALALACASALAADTVVIDSFDYGSAEAARQVWTPVYELPVVDIVERGGGSALWLPCPFSRDVQRSLYHRDAKPDLSTTAWVEFDLFVNKPEAVTQFTLYLISGSGCYRGSVGAGGATWRRVRLNKASFKPEGTPDGWHNISGMRFSPWKGVSTDAFCVVDNLVATSGGDISIVIGTHTVKERPKEARSVYDCAERVASLLETAGVPANTLEDEDVERGRLADAKVAILPYNPSLSEAELEAFTRFVQHGGKLITFYTLPEPVFELLGLRKVSWMRRTRDGQFLDIDLGASGIAGMPSRIRQNSWNLTVVEPAAKNARVAGRWVDGQGEAQPQPAVVISDTGAFMAHTLLPGDTARKRQFLAALVAHFCPSVWQDVAQTTMARAGRIGMCRDAKELVRFVRERLNGHPKAAEARQSLDRGSAHLAVCDTHCKAQRWVEAMAAAQEARSDLVEAYLASQLPLDGEWRAVSNHPGTGGEPGGWGESAQVLAECGFNAVLPDMAWGGVAHYASDVLPRSDTFRARGDQLAQCVAACHRHGVQVHAWKVNWNLGRRAPRDFVDRLRAEGRLQTSDGGKEVAWLCPSHPANLRLETEAMLEMVRKYDVDGIMFDYIRYRDAHVCFCDGCRTRFQHDTGQQIANWPTEVTSGRLRDAYRSWRCDQITRLVRAVSRDAHALKPYVRVSAAVFSRYPSCRAQVGQDWVAWVREGLLDFVIPMDSADSGAAIQAMVKGQVEMIDGQIPLCPSLFVTLSSRVLTPDQATAQIIGSRQAGADGFNLFDHSSAMSGEYLRRLAGRVIGGRSMPSTDAPVFRFEFATDDPRQVTVSLVRVRPMRQPVVSLSGSLELQDLEGRTVEQLGPAPSKGKPRRVRLSASPGTYRLAVVGQLVFDDQSANPFVTRSRVVTMPELK